jgi:hypothetical protein
MNTEEQIPEEERGAFCGVIQQQLVVSSCPLMKGTCMWKNRLHGRCTYTTEELTTEEFTQRVGLPPLEPAVVNILRSSLKHKISNELTD